VDPTLAWAAVAALLLVVGALGALVVGTAHLVSARWRAALDLVASDRDRWRAVAEEHERRVDALARAAGRAAAAAAGLAATEATIADGLGAGAGLDPAERARLLLVEAARRGGAVSDPASPGAPEPPPEPAGGAPLG
jgi:hypothetical protein